MLEKRFKGRVLVTSTQDSQRHSGVFWGRQSHRWLRFLTVLKFSCVHHNTHSARRMTSSPTLTLWGPIVTLCLTILNIQEFYIPPTECSSVFCMDLTTNSDYSAISLLCARFNNRDSACSLHGSKRTFKNQRGWLCFIEDLSMTQTISRQSHTAEAGVRSRFRSCKIYSGQSGTWKGPPPPPPEYFGLPR
jgi:hypothetical protein